MVFLPPSLMRLQRLDLQFLAEDGGLLMAMKLGPPSTSFQSNIYSHLNL